jgi:hypothetical protein
MKRLFLLILNWFSNLFKKKQKSDTQFEFKKIKTFPRNPRHYLKGLLIKNRLKI